MNKWKYLLLPCLYLILVLAFSELLYLVSFEVDHSPVLKPILDAEFYNDEQSSVWSQLTHRALVQPFNLISFVIFVCAISHIFLAHKFSLIAEKIRDRNIRLKKHHVDTFSVEFMHFMGEIEVVFGLWVIPLMIAMSYFYSWSAAIHYLNGIDYTEPLFVLVIMTLAATKPITQLTENIIRSIASLGGGSVKAWWLTILILTPLLGSFITEPAAMTIAAILLGRQFYSYNPTSKFSYATLGLLFTNVSVGGVLTNFAAPPVLLVVQAWEWNTWFMLTTFGVKAIVGIFIATSFYYFVFRKEFAALETRRAERGNRGVDEEREAIPFGVSFIHVMFLAWIVVHLHFPVIFVGTFLLFLGFYRATKPYQGALELKTPTLVAFFLAGLIVHGNLQGWWVSPLLANTTEEVLMVLSVVLTAFNDNAEVTFLATLIPDFADSMKYSVVAGAVAGGGLTVIANAPNLAGQSILSRYFHHGISALYLFFGALIPTLILIACFYFAQPY